MSDLIGELRKYLIDAYYGPPAGICTEIYDAYKVRGDLAEVLREYTKEQLSDALSQAKRNVVTKEEESKAYYRKQREEAAEQARQDTIRQKMRDEQTRADFERSALPIIPTALLARSRPAFQRRAEYDPPALDAALLRDYPGIRPDAVRLILAAIGYARVGKATEPPMVWLHGPNGGGKTNSAILAAGIACTEVSRHTGQGMGESTSALQSKFCQAARADQIVFLDELDTMRDKRRLSSHLPCLTRGESYTWRGNEDEISALAPVILASKEFLPCFWQDRALARRIVHVNLGRGRLDSREWDANPIQEWRSKNPDAADALVSEVIDRFFRRPITWAEIAGELGFATLIAYRQQIAWDFVSSLPESLASSEVGEGWRFVPLKQKSKKGADAARRFAELRDVLRDEGYLLRDEAGGKRIFLRPPSHFEATERVLAG